jgi:hypothetical protein
MNRWRVLLGAVAAVVASARSQSPAKASSETLSLRWADLVAPQPPGTTQLARPTVAEGEVDIMVFALCDRPLDDFHVDAC